MGDFISGGNIGTVISCLTTTMNRTQSVLGVTVALLTIVGSLWTTGLIVWDMASTTTHISKTVNDSSIMLKDHTRMLTEQRQLQDQMAADIRELQRDVMYVSYVGPDYAVVRTYSGHVFKVPVLQSAEP